MKLVFFGDSICFGQHVSPHLTWVHKVSEQLCASNDALKVANSSISGNTTRMALDRFHFDVLSHGLDAIYIQFGLNDCNFWETDKGIQRVPPNSFVSNLKEIIGRARANGCEQVFIGTNHPTTKVVKHAFFEGDYQQSSASYNALIRDIADSEDARLIDHERYWQRNIKDPSFIDELLLEDRIHLSEKGHQWYTTYTIEATGQYFK